MRSWTIVFAVATLAACSSPSHPVSVLYAGSLVTPMQGSIAKALAKRGITFDGEARGSKEIANLIVAGLRKPDVVILVNRAVEKSLERKGLVAQSWILGSTSLGIGWSALSSRASEARKCEQGRGTHMESFAGKCLVGLLSSPGIRIARTDPRLDPKGQYTIEAAHILLGSREREVLGPDDNAAQIFPEESLLVHLESGDSDVGFVYEIEARSRHLDFWPLPGKASLSDKIVYTISIMKNAPHSATARAFTDFILSKDGTTLLRDAGLHPVGQD